MESALYGVYASFYLFIYLFIDLFYQKSHSFASFTLDSLVRFLVGQQLERKYRTPVLYVKYSIFIVLIFRHLILQARCNFNAI